MAENTEIIQKEKLLRKTLANCSLKDFLRQTNKIRHAAADFYKIIGIADIRKILPTYKGDETPEEKEKLRTEQGKKNISLVLDKCLDENIDKTIEIIGLMCFKSAEEAAEMDAGEFLDVCFDVLGSERVITFFTKLVSSGLIDTAKL